MKPTYTILGPLGEGGMGRVVLAEEADTKRKVALKYLSALDDRARGLFREEAALLSRLAHPNLVRIYDYEDRPEPRIAMEYVDGPTLVQAVKTADERTLLALFVQTCRGLNALHARGLLHRDLKPANVVVSQAGTVKLLDMGVARVGTPAYLPPEALGGDYDRRGELYSLGVTWREVTSGRKLPPFFSDLLDKLVAKDPNERPGSALALVKYVNRHVAEPFAISPEEDADAVLERPAWVERPEEKFFWEARSALIAVTGPTGVGRTRFLEEVRWKLRLAGRPFTTHADLHEETAENLASLQLALRSKARAAAPHFTILEYNDDFVTEPLKELLAYASSWEGFRTVALGDLKPAATQLLIRNALLDRALDPKEEARIVRDSGGRPLLVLEALRRRGTEIPKNVAQATRIKTEALSDDARRLLALIVAPADAPGFDDVERAWTGPEGASERLADARLELRAEGILDGARLRHPSLKAAFRDALSGDALAAAHRAWIESLTKTVVAGASTREAYRLCAHALAVGDDATARGWLLPALDFLSKSGDWDRTLDLARRLEAVAETPLERAIVFAHQAPAHYRQGRYDDALAAYDAWHKHKPDDGTGVEVVKHRVRTGLTCLTAGRAEDARRRLNEALAAGNSARHAHHRPFHAEAHLHLSALESDDERARAHLREALALAAGEPLIQGEIEHRLGEIEDRNGRAETALAHFRKSSEYYRAAEAPAAEATARNSIAMSLRLSARRADGLEDAWREIAAALSLAETGGEVLQIARYRANRGLVAMDFGRYGDALSDFEASRDAVDQFGTDVDRALLARHRGELEAFLGRSSARALEAAKDTRRSRAEPVMDASRPIESALEDIRAFPQPEVRADLYGRLARDAAAAGLNAIALSLRNAAFSELDDIRKNLPEELKMDFEKRPDLKKLNDTLVEMAPKPSPAGGKGHIPAARFRQFCAINRQIALKNDMGEILDRVIDAAVEITGAERGFVLLKDAKAPKAAIPGFDVKVARNLNRDALKGDDFELSLSLVKQAIDKAAYVLTDDAFSDPRFSEKKSVMDYRLRSVLVVPLEESDGDGGRVFGVLYLDHRYQPDCFSEEDLTLVNALAAQASLAIQKARFVDELRRSRDRLADEVKDQAAKIEGMAEELTKKRGELRYGYEDIIGQSPAMLKVFQVLDDVSETSIPVWIHGESGTGKELVARSLHVNSPRAKGPFVAENVSAIPETLLESELFGHKKGSFTHADRDRIGLFEQASGGTLFLDEVADMSLAMQAKLLRVLQEGEVRPVGAAKKVKIDVRLVTASNRDLARMVEEGKFRQDLFFRINGLTIDLPALRRRKEDIPLLVRHFSKRIAREFNVSDAEVTDRAFKSLMAHDWPGNVRELEAVLRNALLFAKGKPIGPDHLTIKATAATERGYPAEPGARGSTRSAGGGEGEDAAHRALVVTTLKRHAMDKEAAARELKVSLRTLYTWMEKHGIPKKKALLAQYLAD